MVGNCLLLSRNDLCRCRGAERGAAAQPTSTRSDAPERSSARESGVSALKPLCGIEPYLFENLQTFCVQTIAAQTQLLFGIASSIDPAVSVVRKLQEAYPEQNIERVVDAKVHGTNLKVSNLINLEAHIRHAVVVLADSDIAVDPHYLENVTAPLAHADNGIVTCLYDA